MINLFTKIFNLLFNLKLIFFTYNFSSFWLLVELFRWKCMRTLRLVKEHIEKKTFFLCMHCWLYNVLKNFHLSSKYADFFMYYIVFEILDFFFSLSSISVTYFIEHFLKCARMFQKIIKLKCITYACVNIIHFFINTKLK